jgi:endonuclease YncB( thermonuclease family)
LHKYLRRVIAPPLVFVFSHSALADALVRKVVRVADGDTLTILDAKKRQHKIRLDGIDAPERKQAFGKASWQSLAGMCAGKKRAWTIVAKIDAVEQSAL